MKYLALLLILLPAACEKVEVTDAHKVTLMNGAEEYYVKGDGNDIQVTKTVYELVEGHLVKLTADERLLCDFEKMPRAKVTDMATCRVKQ